MKEERVEKIKKDVFKEVGKDKELIKEMKELMDWNGPIEKKIYSKVVDIAIKKAINNLNKEHQKEIKELKKQFEKMIDDLDLELFLTDLQNTKTKEIIQIPKGIRIILERYTEHIQNKLKSNLKG